MKKKMKMKVRGEKVMFVWFVPLTAIRADVLAPQLPVPLED